MSPMDLPTPDEYTAADETEKPRIGRIGGMLVT